MRFRSTSLRKINKKNIQKKSKGKQPTKSKSQPARGNKILQKEQELRQKGFPLGNRKGSQQDAGYGGAFQRYRNANIYWHKVMGNSAHEVHGAILAAYDKTGGPRNRNLGFPISDEVRLFDGSVALNNFEWGALYKVPGIGAVKIYGEIYKKWKNSGYELGSLGLPIVGNTQFNEIELAVFERGFLWKRKRNNSIFYLDMFFSQNDFPTLGKPKIINPKFIKKLKIFDASILKLQTFASPTTQDIEKLIDVLENKIFLRPVFTYQKKIDEIPLIIRKINSKKLVFTIDSKHSSHLKNRNLYNISYRVSNKKSYDFSPHSIYVSDSSWNNFTFVHAPDIHVGRHIDQILPKIQKLTRQYGLTSSVNVNKNNFNNNNNNFRNFIKYANRLHAAGKLDLILAVGDIIDYHFETGDNEKSGGNFKFLNELILGKGKSPERIQNEELRVPIFTTLGNHDYRAYPYKLISKIKITAKDLANWLPSWLNFEIKKIPLDEYEKFNLNQFEAMLHENFRNKKGQLDVAEYSPSESQKAMKLEEGLRYGRGGYYYQHINRKVGTYTINLGKHTIVMTNSKHDRGMTFSIWKAGMASFLGMGDEDTIKFVQIHINSVGYGKQDYEKIEQALTYTKRYDGLLIIATHAPPFHPASAKTFSHYFRETEHARAVPQHIYDFLLKNTDTQFIIKYIQRNEVLPKRFRQYRGGINPAYYPALNRKIKDVKKNIIAKMYPDWSPGHTFFKKGKGVGDPKSYYNDPLMRGISRGEQKFLRYCVGDFKNKKVDLVLTGHCHSQVEYRVKKDGRDKLEFYTDFYTDNPKSFYSSRFYPTTEAKYPDSEYFKKERKLFVKVNKNINRPSSIKRRFSKYGPSKSYYEQEIPPFKEPLNQSKDPKKWWDKYKPLFIQNAPLGPLDKHQREDEEGIKDSPDPSFQGIRLIHVENDVITQIKHIPLEGGINPRKRIPIGRIFRMASNIPKHSRRTVSRKQHTNVRTKKVKPLRKLGIVRRAHRRI